MEGKVGLAGSTNRYNVITGKSAPLVSTRS